MTVHISIDEDLCQGTGECAAIAADAVSFDDDGIAVPTGVTVAADVAERMVRTCPSSAISIDGR